MTGVQTCALPISAVAEGADAAIPGIAVADTIKQVASKQVAGNQSAGARHVVHTPDRASLVAVQTPQAFRAEVLRAAHVGADDATDDAGLVERNGGTVVVVPGDPRSRKVTDRDDLVVLEAWLAEDDR